MKCPNCGYSPKLGRPKILNDDMVKLFSNKGFSLQKIAGIFGVTRGAIQASLKRYARKR